MLSFTYKEGKSKVQKKKPHELYAKTISEKTKIKKTIFL